MALRFLDLFAGCGGLSLGLEYAGLEIVAAVEKSEMAAETHFKNFHLRGEEWSDKSQEKWEALLKGSFLEQLKTGTVVGDVTKLLGDKESMDFLRDEGRPDVIVGGPPCQGFSLAGSRNNKDERNVLPGAFLDFVRELQPRAVVIENVVGINRAFVKEGESEAPFKQLQLALEKCTSMPRANGPSNSTGYVVQAIEANAWTFGVPQSRPRMMLIALRGDLAIAKKIKREELVSEKVWRSVSAFKEMEVEGSPCSELALVPRVGSRVKGSPEHQVFTAGNALCDLDDAGYLPNANSQFYKTKGRSYAKSMRGDLRKPSGPLSNHVLRKHSVRVIQRFALYHYLAQRGIDNSVLGIPHLSTEKAKPEKKITEGEARARLLKALGPYSESLPDKSFSEESDGSLFDVVVRLETRKHSQRVIDKDKPAPTVVTLPDDYVHPTKHRVMTVRELARLQSFPDWFEFRSKETTGSDRRKDEVPQYTQVGNAVPPLMAQAVGELIVSLLEVDGN
jgi:DNA (cytosine-5)-methyltransferase 1